MILISVDDHIIRAAGQFQNHPGEIQERAPRLVHNPDGSGTWRFRDTVIPNVALNAVAGRPKEEYGLGPQGPRRDPHGLLRRPSGSGHERRRHPASMNFPSFPGFAARLFRHRGRRLLPWHWCAYNDRHIDEVVRCLPGPVHPDGAAR